MPIEMPKGLPFSVDTWSPASKRKRYHFLTHAHSDHLAGIASHAAYPIYSTRLTRSLVLRHLPQLDESLFVELEVGRSVVVDDPDGAFTVTAFDANHCPGAVMFLFEGEFGNILHTGDCRLTPDCLQYLPLKYLSKKGRENLCHLDYLFLDCTFGRCSLKIPSKQTAIRQVISCIWKHPNAPVVYLACDLLGLEEILVEVSRTFGSKIYVDKTINSECYRALQLVAPEILSQDASSHFQVVEAFPRLCERAQEKLADARANLQPEPLFIRPSAQWFAAVDHLEMTRRQKPKLAEAERDEFGVWHVCYSIHSSREELEWALQLLQPKWVISTTPPCRAMELDYVKKHCFKTQITPDDPLWKLLKVRTGKSSSLPPTASVVLKNDSVSTSTVGTSTSTECNQLLSKSLSINHFKLKLDLSPSSRVPAITLFGRARVGLPDYDVLQEEKSEFTVAKNKAEAVFVQEDIVFEEASSFQEGNVAIIEPERSLPESGVAEQSSCLLEDNAKLSIEKPEEEVNVKSNISCNSSPKSFSIAESSVEKWEETELKRDMWRIGSSRNLNANLRKLYRSMNVPVPRPLPSLIELMGSSKRVKNSSGSSFSKLSNHCNSPKYLSS